ncbi:unnamed protein product [Ectocarpus sp. 12 AP-2014]
MTTAPKTPAQLALDALDQAWAYFAPEPVAQLDDQEPDLFQYHAAA